MTTQQSPFLELVVRGARLVQSHPMDREQRTKDDKPVFEADGVTPSMESYFAIAMPKNGTTAWSQTEWGAQVASRAAQDWPNGEHQIPTFAWKIEDGDSTIPNQKGKKNADREGYPGHWIIKGSTLRVVKAWDGSNPSGDMLEVLDKNAIKTGDYCDVSFQVKGNAPAKSQGMYLNPVHFVFTRAGASLSSSLGSSAADLFGRATTSAAVAAGAPAPVVAPPVAATPPPATIAAPPAVPSAAPAPIATPPPVVAPHDFLNAAPAAPAAPPVEEKYSYDGQVFTRAALEAANWPAASIDALPRA